MYIRYCLYKVTLVLLHLQPTLHLVHDHPALRLSSSFIHPPATASTSAHIPPGPLPVPIQSTVSPRLSRLTTTQILPQSHVSRTPPSMHHLPRRLAGAVSPVPPHNISMERRNNFQYIYLPFNIPPPSLFLPPNNPSTPPVRSRHITRAPSLRHTHTHTFPRPVTLTQKITNPSSQKSLTASVAPCTCMASAFPKTQNPPALPLANRHMRLTLPSCTSETS